MDDADEFSREDVPEATKKLFLRDFGDMRSCWKTVILEVDPFKLRRVASCTWRYLNRFINRKCRERWDPLITEDHFVLAYQCLIAERLRDISQPRIVRKKGDYIFKSGIKIPRSMAELLYHLGTFVSQDTGITYRYALSSTALKDACIENEWEDLEAEVMSRWFEMMSLVKNNYELVDFPSASSTKGTALPLCVKVNYDHSNVSQIFLTSTEPKEEEIFQRFIHEEFYKSPPYQRDQAHIIASSKLHVNVVLESYVGSFLK